jgi:hypothetical protein
LGVIAAISLGIAWKYWRRKKLVVLFTPAEYSIADFFFILTIISESFQYFWLLGYKNSYLVNTTLLSKIMSIDLSASINTLDGNFYRLLNMVIVFVILWAALVPVLLFNIKYRYTGSLIASSLDSLASTIVPVGA